MRKITFALVLVMLTMVFLPLIPSQAGAFNSRRPVVTVKDIYNDFDKYNGRIVRMKATVVEQDDRGFNTWLVLSDEGGVIKVLLWVYGVNFHRNVLGDEIEVTGKVGSVDDRYVIKATEIRYGNFKFKRTGNAR